MSTSWCSKAGRAKYLTRNNCKILDRRESKDWQREQAQENPSRTEMKGRAVDRIRAEATTSQLAGFPAWSRSNVTQVKWTLDCRACLLCGWGVAPSKSGRIGPHSLGHPAGG